MVQHQALYEAAFAALAAVVAQPALVPLLCPLAGQRESLCTLLTQCRRTAAVFLGHIARAAVGQPPSAPRYYLLGFIVCRC